MVLNTNFLCNSNSFAVSSLMDNVRTTGKLCVCVCAHLVNWICDAKATEACGLMSLCMNTTQSPLGYNECLLYGISFPWSLPVWNNTFISALFLLYVPDTHSLAHSHTHSCKIQYYTTGFLLSTVCELSEPGTRLSCDTKHFLISSLLFPVRSRWHRLSSQS